MRTRRHAPGGSTLPRTRRTAITTAAVVVATIAVTPLGGQETGAAGDAGRTFTVDDAIDMVRVSGPRLSPDGSRILFTRNELDWEKNKRVSRIWVVGADGRNARPFTGSPDDRSAEWSPDGRWVSFTRPAGEGDGKVRQLFLLPVDGGEAAQLTKHATAVGSHRWSADGTSIFFLASDSLPDDLEKERKNGDDAIFIDEGPNGQTRGSWNGVWQVTAGIADAPREAKRLTEEGRIVGNFAPSPNGNFLAYTYRGENRRNAGHLSEVALLTIESGEEILITGNDAPESQLAWSPDGRAITFVAPDLETWELDQGNLYHYHIPTGETRQLMAHTDMDMRGYRWNPGGRSIDIVALDRTVANLYRVDVRSGDIEQITHETGVVSSASYDRLHRLAAFQFAGPTETGDLWLADLEDGTKVRLTEANPGLADKDLVRPEVVRWRSFDGLEIEGLLYRPVDRTSPGPTILEIHGGPAGVFTQGFDADAQILVSQGYAVLQPNVRGSSGYGDALLRGNMNDIGGGDYEDLMTGVDAIIERGVAHPDSLAVKGWSYGGILGGWTITRTDRFKAASLGAMVADWRSEFGSGFNFDVVRWYLGGDPWSNRDHWTERSAYTHVDRVKTPTILFHGANDRTDTMEQSMNFFAGLRHLGVEARFILFPREGHGITEPRHRRTLMMEEMRWLHRYVKGMTDWEPPPRPAPDKETEKKVIS